MNLLAKVGLAVVVLFSSAVMSQELIVNCKIKMEKSQRSKIIKLAVYKSAIRKFQVGSFNVKVKSFIAGKGYGTALTLIFEVIDKKLVDSVTEIVGRKVQLNQVSYGSLEPFILSRGYKQQSLIARCSLE